MIEIYVLACERTKALAERFLDEFAPSRTLLNGSLEIPEFTDDPVATFTSVSELLEYLETQPDLSYSLYWKNNSEGGPINMMIFFLHDGGMLVGVDVDEGDEANWLRRLATVVRGRYGKLAFETPPDESVDAFVMSCRASDLVRLVSGNLIDGPAR